MMRVGITTWHDRISPVFDVARNLLVVEVQDGQEVDRQQVELKETAPNLRALEVGKLNLDVLICGAVSQPLENILGSLGIRVVARLCGEAEEILRAFISGGWTEEVFLMPGCGLGLGRGRGGGRGQGQGGGRGQGQGGGRGGGRGQGQGGGRGGGRGQGRGMGWGNQNFTGEMQ